MKNEITTALKKREDAVKQNKVRKFFRNAYAAGSAVTAMASLTGTQVFAAADNAWGDEVSITASGTDASSLMGKVIGILLTITRFVGVALLVYGVYEIVMSFMQNQPEAKTKGIIMALSGVAMIALKSILSGLGVIS